MREVIRDATQVWLKWTLLTCWVPKWTMWWSYSIGKPKLVQVHLIHMWLVVPYVEVNMILMIVLILSRYNLLTTIIEMLKITPTQTLTIRGGEIIQIFDEKIKAINKTQPIRQDSNQDNHKWKLNRVERSRWKSLLRLFRIDSSELRGGSTNWLGCIEIWRFNWSNCQCDQQQKPWRIGK